MQLVKKVRRHFIQIEEKYRQGKKQEGAQKKITQDILVGEIARLSAVMDRIMVRQQSAPHDIANAFQMLCGQFGVSLPENFVKVPEYRQMQLPDGQ